MTQHDLVIDNDTRPAVRADITAALQALGSMSKGNARPATPYAGQPWLDDNTPSTSIWSWYVWTGSADIKLGEFDTSGNNFMPFVNGLALSAVYAPLASPALTGNPTAPTQTAGNNSTRLATTAFVQSALSGAGGVLSKQIYTATGAFTFTTPSNITTSTVFKITLTGGGGGGGGDIYGSGGGAAATITFWVSGLSPSTGYSGSVGAGGSGSTTNGSNGGNTTITIGATTYTAGGGAGGVTNGDGGAGGSGTNGELTIPGQRGGRGMTSTSINLGGHGGSSFWGGGGSNNANGANGYNGAAYGSGGSGGAGSGSTGGSGANGVALIEWQ